MFLALVSKKCDLIWWFYVISHSSLLFLALVSKKCDLIWWFYVVPSLFPLFPLYFPLRVTLKSLFPSCFFSLSLVSVLVLLKNARFSTRNDCFIIGNAYFIMVSLCMCRRFHYKMTFCEAPRDRPYVCAAVFPIKSLFLVIIFGFYPLRSIFI